MVRAELGTDLRGGVLRGRLQTRPSQPAARATRVPSAVVAPSRGATMRAPQDRLGSQEARKGGNSGLGGDAPDLKGWPCEVQQQAVVESNGAEVGAHDSEVNVLDEANGLELHDDAMVDEEVEPMVPDLDAAVTHRDRDLPREGEPAPLQLDAHRLAVDGLEEAGPKGSMNFDGRADDLVGQLLVLEGHRRNVPGDSGERPNQGTGCRSTRDGCRRACSWPPGILGSAPSMQGHLHGGLLQASHTRMDARKTIPRKVTASFS